MSTNPPGHISLRYFTSGSNAHHRDHVHLFNGKVVPVQPEEDYRGQKRDPFVPVPKGTVLDESVQVCRRE